MLRLRTLAAAAAALCCAAALTACDPDGSGSDGATATAASSTSPSAASAPASAPASAAASASASAGKPGGAPSTLPAGIWIATTDVPLDSVYHWQTPSAVAKAAKAPAFQFETLCHSKRSADLDTTAKGAQNGAVAQLGKGGAAEWQAQETILSWGPAKSSGPAQTAYAFTGSLAAEVKACASTAPGATVKVDTEDGGNLFVATLTVPQSGGGSVTLHEYLTTSGATVAELSVWASVPAGGKPRTAWSAPSEIEVGKALGVPICTALKDC
ncbi:MULTISPECIES: hypothetical protein [Kitasatospora]|uniref:Lipoprotein n=2 Tax=Kitasatospora TaxID=2063 RepID=A0ABT1JA70_9ACTN|nr:hypothetical protein [Kitasatospora paracochleata]MCP2313571.1 hypothetical protein [Kitasatospora paracochleata]